MSLTETNHHLGRKRQAVYCGPALVETFNEEKL